MVKKITIFLLILLLVSGLTACNGDEGEVHKNISQMV